MSTHTVSLQAVCCVADTFVEKEWKTNNSNVKSRFSCCAILMKLIYISDSIISQKRSIFNNFFTLFSTRNLRGGGNFSNFGKSIEHFFACGVKNFLDFIIWHLNSHSVLYSLRYVRHRVVVICLNGNNNNLSSSTSEEKSVRKLITKLSRKLIQNLF